MKKDAGIYWLIFKEMKRSLPRKFPERIKPYIFFCIKQKRPPATGDPFWQDISGCSSQLTPGANFRRHLARFIRHVHTHFSSTFGQSFLGLMDGILHYLRSRWHRRRSLQLNTHRKALDETYFFSRPQVLRQSRPSVFENLSEVRQVLTNKIEWVRQLKNIIIFGDELLLRMRSRSWIADRHGGLKG